MLNKFQNMFLNSPWVYCSQLCDHIEGEALELQLVCHTQTFPWVVLT